MTANIEDIIMWTNNPDKSRVSNVVRVNFKFPCTWTIFNLDELKKIISLWIDGELMRYPLKDYQSFLFMKFIQEIFIEKIGFKDWNRINNEIIRDKRTSNHVPFNNEAKLN